MTLSPSQIDALASAISRQLARIIAPVNVLSPVEAGKKQPNRLTTAEAAAVLGRSVATVNRLRKSGVLVPLTKTHPFLYDASEVSSLLNK
jgi:hypothetical protein